VGALSKGVCRRESEHRVVRGVGDGGGHGRKRSRNGKVCRGFPTRERDGTREPEAKFHDDRQLHTVQWWDEVSWREKYPDNMSCSCLCRSGPPESKGR
jgi:hypothetical protein